MTVSHARRRRAQERPVEKRRAAGRRRRRPAPEFPAPEDVERYLDDLALRGSSPASLKTYRKTLRQVLPAIRPGARVEDVLALAAHLAPATRARYVYIARGFACWARETGRTAQPILLDRPRLRAPVKVPRPVDAAQLAALDVRAWRSPNGDARLFYFLLREAGLRFSEALTLRGDACETTRGVEHIRVTGKGGRGRVVPLRDGRLLALLRRRREQRGPMLGWSETKAREIWAALDPGAITPHDLRAALALELVRTKQFSPFELRQFFGWASLETAASYVDVAQLLDKSAGGVARNADETCRERSACADRAILLRSDRHAVHRRTARQSDSPEAEEEADGA